MSSLNQISLTKWVISVVVLSVLVFYFFNPMKDTTENLVVDIEKNPIVTLDTNLGAVDIELFIDKSPVTAGNFKKLVEEGFYDGTRFHRVIPSFMIQGGDPLSKDIQMQTRWGTGGPGYAIEDEFVEGLSNIRGTISMANSGPQSGGSQFFINLVDNTNLDWDKPPAQSKHPVFGAVVYGMDIVDKIGSVATEDQNRPVEDIVINKATVK